LNGHIAAFLPTGISSVCCIAMKIGRGLSTVFYVYAAFGVSAKEPFDSVCRLLLGKHKGLDRSPHTTLRMRKVIPASDEQADVCIIMSVILKHYSLYQSVEVAHHIVLEVPWSVTCWICANGMESSACREGATSLDAVNLSVPTFA
jgi:hypothetical protein